MNPIYAKRLQKPYGQREITEAVGLVLSGGGVGDPLASIKRGGRVLLKPNLVADLPAELGAVTDPRVVLAACMHLAERGFRPVVAESSSVGVDTRAAMALEYGTITGHGFPLIPLDGTATVTLDAGDGGCPVPFFDIVRDVDAIVSVPKLKTHDQTIVTLGVKNLKGLLPDADKVMVHRHGLHRGIARVHSALKGLGIPVFSLVDGLVGMEGLGPVFGTPVPMGFVAFGDDIVGTDRFCCGMMGVDSGTVEHLCLASPADARTVTEVRWLGEPVEPRRFKPAAEALAELAVEGVGFEWEGACTGCRNTILSVLSELAYNEVDVAGTVFVAGKAMDCGSGTQGRPGTRRITVGNCAGCGAVPGCPPVNEDVIGRVLGREGQCR